MFNLYSAYPYVHNSIGAQDLPFRSNGAPVPPPTEYFPNGLPEGFHISRGAYETILRFLVTGIPNIRFVSGTVSEVKRSTQDAHKLGAVVYRAGGDAKTTIEQKAELVVGKCFYALFQARAELNPLDYHRL